MNLIELFGQSASREIRKVEGRNRASHAARKRNTLKRYSDTFNGDDLVTNEVAARLGISNSGCYMTLLRLERNGYIKRVGTRPTGGTKPTIIWQWVQQQEGN